MKIAALAVGLFLLVLTSAVLSWRARRQVLARIRAGWGRPLNRKRPMEAIDSYSRARASSEDLLDDRTWHDLNMDDMFARLDRTQSTIGQQVLYHRLRSMHSLSGLAAFESLVSRLSTDTSRRERTQVALASMQDPAGYDLWAIAMPGAVERRGWHVLFPLLGVAMLALIVLGFVWPGLFLVAVCLMAVHVFIRLHSAMRIMTLVGPFRQISALIAAAETIVALFHVDRLALLETLAGDVRGLARLKRIVRSVGPAPTASGELATLLMDYVNLAFLLDVNAVYFAARELDRCGASLSRVIETVGEVDAAIGVASYRAETSGWTRPVFVTPGAPVVFDALAHPLLDAAVPNSLALKPGDGALITGSNMSGKTTFIRTAGVNAVLAQTINTVLAQRYEAPYLRVRSCIGSTDDLLAGKSYYFVELEGVLRLVHDSAQETPHLFLLDELFRGTNAVERIAGAEAVLRQLVRDGARRRPHYALAATHDAELVDLLADVYAAFHFCDRIGGDGLAFDYKLEPGVSTTRNALALLRLHGAPASMVEQALDRAAELDRTRAPTPNR